jgi:putative ABC transport system permease protein
MRLSDHIHQSLANLWKKKLRTFLTTAGVLIGIGALFSMLAFGKGMQKNVTERFARFDLFRYLVVFGPSDAPRNPHRRARTRQSPITAPPLDDARLAEIAKIPGVETVVPEIRFPALIRRDDNERFTLVQALPAEIVASGLVTFRAGAPYTHDDPNAVIISESLMDDMGFADPRAAVGQALTIATLTLDAGSLFNPLNFAAALTGDALPFAQKDYTFTIVGVAERMDIGMGGPLRSDVFITPHASAGMKKIALTNIRDLFKSSGTMQSYPAAGIRLTSADQLDSVKAAVEAWGYRTFALADEIDEIETAFILMDMFLFAIGMIAITVASLGIVNTMVMATLERYREIGIMKAVGARNSDVRRIFFFESGAIGFLGGLFGVTLGWLASLLINRIVNIVLTAKGVPTTNYFTFPLWLWLASIAFAILVSLAAGLYPAIRAANTDPIKALRHD